MTFSLKGYDDTWTNISCMKKNVNKTVFNSQKKGYITWAALRHQIVHDNIASETR